LTTGSVAGTGLTLTSTPFPRSPHVSVSSWTPCSDGPEPAVDDIHAVAAVDRTVIADYADSWPVTDYFCLHG
jgi:hypothetical protein